jgi:two-component system sensor histidine kinase DesK
VREVVRGYRDADLANELAGSQGVLTAAGIDCAITGTAAELPAQVQSALGWVVREATTNVLRHGNARKCALSLRVTRELVTLTVENDGVPREAGPGPGPDGGSGPRRGSGLVGLRERLDEVDGVLRAGASGGVFRLTAEVPLRPSPDTRADTPGKPAPGSDEAPRESPVPPVPHPMREATP